MPRYYKLLREELVHNGFTYKEGLNVLAEPFKGASGLHFSEEKDIFHWLDRLYGDDIEWIAAVQLCPDSRVVYGKNECKTDKFILGPIRSISDFVNDPRNTETVVKLCGEMLRYVEEQTPELCLAAIQENPNALRFVKEQTPELCLAAVQRNGMVLWDVKEQTPEICLAAVQQTWYALQFVKEQTSEMCLAAYAQDKAASQYFKHRPDNDDLNHILY